VVAGDEIIERKENENEKNKLKFRTKITS